MSLTVTHEPDAERYVARSGDDVRGVVAYASAPGVLRLIHVEVPPFQRNRGIGGEVVQAVLDHLRTHSTDRVVPSCPFAVTWMRRHPEYADLTTR